MKTFKIYKHPVFEYEAVKSGVSFPILFFTIAFFVLVVYFYYDAGEKLMVAGDFPVLFFPIVFFAPIWMLYKKLWTQFWGFTIYIVSIGFLYQSGQLYEWATNYAGNFWFWSGASLLIYVLYPFINGNTWLAKQLEKEGYKLVDVVQASNKNRAIEIAEYNYKNPDEKGESKQLSTSADAAILIIIAFVVIMLMLN
jgi:hypothetical protein